MFTRPTTPLIAVGWFTSKALCRANASTSTIVGVENLKVQLDRFHVERDVLLGFPAHQLARLRFLDALDLNLLDDDVAATDGGGDVFRLHAGHLQRGTDRIGHDR